MAIFRPLPGNSQTALDRSEETYVVSGTLKHIGLSGFQLNSGTSGLTIESLEGPDNAADFSDFNLGANEELVFNQPITQIKLSAGDGTIYNTSTTTRNWHISNNGSDLNDGSQNSPFRSTNPLNYFELGDKDNIYFEYGSKFRDSLNREANGVTVSAYGDQSRGLPTICCDDVVTGWSVSGTANVYQHSFSIETVSDFTKTAITVYEDDTLLERVDDLVTCGTTPGSFYHAVLTDENVVIYLHPTNSDNPAINGQVYEVSKRLSSIRLGANSTVQNIWSRRNVSDDGSIVVGRFSTVEDCVFEDGTKHNMLIASGVVRGCYAYGFDTNIFRLQGESGIAFQGFVAANEEDDLIFENCVCINKNQTLQTTISGFFAHGASGGDYGTVEVRNCQGYYLNALSLGADDSRSYRTYRNLAYECVRFGAALGESEEDEYWRDTLYTGAASNHVFFKPSNKVDITIDKFKYFSPDGNFIKEDSGPGGESTVILRDSIIWRKTNGPNGSAVRIDLAADKPINVTLQRNVFNNYFGSAKRMLFIDNESSSPNISSDFNVVTNANTRVKIGPTEWTTFADYRTANPALDVNTIVGSSGVTDPAIRDWTLESGGNAETQSINISDFQHTGNYGDLITEIESLKPVLV